MRHRLVWLRALVWGVVGLFAIQASLIAALAALAAWRKRRVAVPTFPHGPAMTVRVDTSTFAVYTYGQDLYDAMLAAIDGAQHTILLDTFIWKDDALGQAFKERLEHKAAAGVQVYVIFDRFGNLVVPASFKRFAPAVQVRAYHAFMRPWQVLDIRFYACDHRKLLVVDASEAFIGGYNIGALYARAWRDTHLRISGPVAAALAADFTAFWNDNSPPQQRLAAGGVDACLDHVTIVRNDPLRLRFPIRDAYLAAIARASRYVYLTTAYFVPDRALRTALIAAARRGVDVRVLLPWQSNHILADWLARGFFATFLHGGVRLFGYQHAMIHAKTITVDGVWSLVGTANLDRLSLTGNYEIAVAVRDAPFADAMEQIFAADLTNAIELSAAGWVQRPWYAKLSERMLAPLWPIV